MSGTTESPAPPVNALPDRGTPPAPRSTAASVADLVHLTQGFYFIFWGLLVTVLISAQIVVSLWLRTFAEVFLLGAVLAMVVGVARLRRVRLDGGTSGPPAQCWQRQVRRLWWVTLLLAYFSLVFYLWRRLPGHPYLQLNALGFVACGLLLLILLNLVIAALAQTLGRANLALESRWFAAVNVVLLVLPLVATAAYVMAMAARRQTNVLLEFQALLGRLNVFVLVALLLPLSLTLSLVWAAKDLALRDLAAWTEPPTPVTPSRP
ncbi:hypothetical protein HQ590_10635 [bacterium]|nr:hypothetical protein [bacterium]